MTRSVPVAACALLVSCSGCKPPAGKEGPPLVRFSKAGPGIIAGIDGPMWGDDPVTIHPLRLTRDGIEVGEGLEVARPASRRPPALAVDGDNLFSGRGSKVERRKPFAWPGIVDECSVEGEPASLLGAGEGCFVGLTGQVDYIDFSSRKPVSRMVHEDPALAKPVDFIVRTAGGIVAVDDEVMPKYAFVLELDAERPARWIYTAELPSGPNETYMDVLAAKDVLVISAVFGVRDGGGNTLYRWPISQGSGPDSAISLEEFAPRDGSARKPTMLAGTEPSGWNGMGILSGRLLVCAGARGLLHMPIDGRAASLLDVGGWCLDLVVIDGRAVVLVALPGDGGEVPRLYDGWEVPGARAIALLSWDASRGALVETARHSVDASIDWLAI